MNKDILKYVGDISQICGMKRYTFSDGFAKGVEAIDVDNGALTFTVLVDRCMDIYSLKYNNIPIAFLSRTGVVAPAFYNERGTEWLRGFGAGFLTTCGFTQVGDPCKIGDEIYGLHGRASFLPATLTQYLENWENDSYIMTISGKVRQSKHEFENIVLQRTIKCALGKNTILLSDVIINEGVNSEPLMLLYHMNFGYPLLSPECEIIIPSEKIVGWDSFSQDNLNSWNHMPEPTLNPRHTVHLHSPEKNSGRSLFSLRNTIDDKRIAVNV